MKVLSIVVVATMVLAVTDAQFRLPDLFSGFRPLFSRPRRPTRPRPRPRPQTIFVSAGQFFNQNEQSNSIPQSSPASSFFPVGPPQEVFQPRPAPASIPSPPPRPAPRPSQPVSRPPPAPRPTQQPPPPPPPSSQAQVVIQRPQSSLRPLSNGGGEFGALKPESILSTSLPFRPTSPVVQIFNDDNRIEEQAAQTSPRRPEQSNIFSGGSTSNFKVTSGNQGIPNPLPLQNDNNIIGMLPPPLPTTSTTTTGSIIVTQPALFSVTSPPAPLVSVTQFSTQSASNTPRPVDIAVTGPETNSIDTLILNPVPLVNAGILPLAGEISNDPQFFPPFNQISVASFNSEQREQRDLFPPFGPNEQTEELFPPFNGNDS